MFVFGVAGESYAYNHIANALRETWCNDDRLRSHDIALSQQLQGGHLAGGVHWTRDGPRLRGLIGTMDIRMVRRRWTRRRILSRGNRLDRELLRDDDDPNDSTFSDHYPALLDQTVETHEGDTSKLETVQEAVAAANAAADMSRRTWTQARQLMKDVHRSRAYFPVSKGNMVEVDPRERQVTRQERTLHQRKGKTSGQEQRKRRGTSWTMSLLCQGPQWARECPVLHTMEGKDKRVNSFGKGHKNSSLF